MLSGRFTLLALVCAAFLAAASASWLMHRGGASDQGGTGNGASYSHVPADGVVGPFIPTKVSIADCDDHGRSGFETRAACFEQTFGNLAFERGAKAALAELTQGMQRDSVLNGNCHRIAHNIGAAAFERHDGDVSAPLADGSTICASGFYHGLLRRAVVDVPPAQLAVSVRKLCSGSSLETAFLRVQCGHGLGHALMINTGQDLPVVLEACDALRGEASGACAGGTYMEIMSAEYTKPADSRWLRSDDLIYPCNDALQRHKQVCYAMLAPRIYSATGGDWQRTGRACEKSETSWESTCFQAIGRLAASLSNHRSAEVNRICGLYRDDARAECVNAAASEFVWDYAGGKEAAVVCRSGPERSRSDCFGEIGEVLSTLEKTTPGFEAACRAVSGIHARSCIAGRRGGASGAAPPTDSGALRAPAQA